MKSVTLSPSAAIAPTYGREPHIVAAAAPLPTAASVVAGILGRSSLTGLCGQFRPEEGRKPGTGTFCVLDNGHTEDHSAGLFYSWPQEAPAADRDPEPLTAVIEKAPLDPGSALLFKRSGTRVRAAYDPDRITATAARSLLRQHVGEFTETAR